MKLRRRTKQKVLLIGLVFGVIFVLTIVSASAGAWGRWHCPGWWPLC